METYRLAGIFYGIVVVVLTMIITSPDTVNGSSDEDDHDEDSCYGYEKQEKFTCCLGIRLNSAFDVSQYLNEDDSCHTALKKVDADDLPTSMHRLHLCIAKAGGATAENLSTYKNYVKYMTQYYAEPWKSKILKTAGKCGDADSEKDEFKRFIAINNCLTLTEGKICEKPGNKTDLDVYSTQFCKEANKEKTFEIHPLCCKGERLPLPIEHDNIPENANAKIVDKCSKSFMRRQKQLYKALKKSVDDDRLNKCEAACNSRGKPYKSKLDLKIDLAKTKKVIFTAFSKSTRKDLLKLFDGYVNEKVYVINDDDNSTLSIKEMTKWKQGLNELEHINMYCKIHEYLSAFLGDLIIDEYCHGAHAKDVASYAHYFASGEEDSDEEDENDDKDSNED